LAASTSIRRPDPLHPRGCTTPGPAGPRDLEEVGPFGVVEAKRAGDGVEDRVGHVEVAALLQPAVVVDAHAGELGDLLTASSRHSTNRARAADLDVVDAEARAAGA
jgi:hypothetical protein